MAMAISATAAVGWFASPVINLMVSKVAAYLSDQYNFSTKMKKNLSKIQSKLDQVLLALSIVKKPSQLNKAQKKVLGTLREHADTAGELLDEFDYLVLKKEDDKKKLTKRIVASSMSVGKRLLQLDSLSNKLDDVLSAVEEMTESAKMFVSVTQNSSSCHSD